MSGTFLRFTRASYSLRPRCDLTSFGMTLCFILTIVDGAIEQIKAVKANSPSSETMLNSATDELISTANKWALDHAGSLSVTDMLSEGCVPSTAKLGYYIVYESDYKKHIIHVLQVTAEGGWMSAPTIVKRASIQLVTDPAMPVIFTKDHQAIIDNYISVVGDQRYTIENLEEKLEASKTSLNKYIEDHAAKELLVERLIVEEKELLKIVRQLDSNIDVTEFHMSLLKSELDDTKDKVQELRKVEENLSVELSKQQAINDDLKQCLHETVHCEAIKDELTESLKAANERIKIFEEEERELIDRVNALEEDCEKSDAELQANAVEIRDLENEVNTLKKDLQYARMYNPYLTPQTYGSMPPISTPSTSYITPHSWQYGAVCANSTNPYGIPYNAVCTAIPTAATRVSKGAAGATTAGIARQPSYNDVIAELMRTPSPQGKLKATSSRDNCGLPPPPPSITRTINIVEEETRPLISDKDEAMNDLERMLKEIDGRIRDNQLF